MNRIARERLINNIIYKLATDESVGHLVEVNKEVSKPVFKMKLKNVLKKFVNANDFVSFVDAYKMGDKAGMKKALPGMLKGVGKVLGTVGAVVGLGYYAKEHILHHALEEATGMNLPKIPVQVLEAKPQEVDKLVDHIFTPNLVENSPLLSTMEKFPTPAEQYEAFENLVPLEDSKELLQLMQANPDKAMGALYHISVTNPKYYHKLLQDFNSSRLGPRFIQNMDSNIEWEETPREWGPTQLKDYFLSYGLYERDYTSYGDRIPRPGALKDMGFKYASSRGDVDNFIDGLAELIQEGVVIEARKELKKKMG